MQVAVPPSDPHGGYNLGKTFWFYILDSVSGEHSGAQSLLREQLGGYQFSRILAS